MRDQRNIHVSKGDALLHLQTGIEYEIQKADDESGEVELLMRVQFVRGPNSRKDSEIPLQGFLKIPRRNDEAENESRAKAIVESVSESEFINRGAFGNKFRALRKAVGL